MADPKAPIDPAGVAPAHLRPGGLTEPRGTPDARGVPLPQGQSQGPTLAARVSIADDSTLPDASQRAKAAADAARTPGRSRAGRRSCSRLPSKACFVRSPRLRFSAALLLGVGNGRGGAEKRRPEGGALNGRTGCGHPRGIRRPIGRSANPALPPLLRSPAAIPRRTRTPEASRKVAGGRSTAGWPTPKRPSTPAGSRLPPTTRRSHRSSRNLRTPEVSLCPNRARIRTLAARTPVPAKSTLPDASQRAKAAADAARTPGRSRAGRRLNSQTPLLRFSAAIPHSAEGGEPPH